MPTTRLAGARGGRTSERRYRAAMRRLTAHHMVALIGGVLLVVTGLACVAPPIVPEQPLPPGDHALSLWVDGRQRSFTVHIPASVRGDVPVPLVVVLHGGGGNADSAARMTAMSGMADGASFIAVYPNGTGGPGGALTWNAGEQYCCGEAMLTRVDDVAFMRALVARVSASATIDARRVYAAGFSNGAMLAHRLGCDAGDLFAAIAAVSGALLVRDCRPAGPVPVIIFHGTADAHVRYAGGRPLRPGPGEGERVDPPVAAAVAFWAGHNGCLPRPQRQDQDGIVRERYAGCEDDTEVVLYTIEGGGHAWPGGLAGGPGGDQPTQAISATPLIWAFFARHARP